MGYNYKLRNYEMYDFAGIGIGYFTELKYPIGTENDGTAIKKFKKRIEEYNLSYFHPPTPSEGKGSEFPLFIFNPVLYEVVPKRSEYLTNSPHRPPFLVTFREISTGKYLQLIGCHLRPKDKSSMTECKNSRQKDIINIKDFIKSKLIRPIILGDFNINDKEELDNLTQLLPNYTSLNYNFSPTNQNNKKAYDHIFVPKELQNQFDPLHIDPPKDILKAGQVYTDHRTLKTRWRW